MATLIKAHFDGENVALDEPCDLASGARVFVLVLEDDEADFRDLAYRSLARAYGEDEPEYRLEDLK